MKSHGKPESLHSTTVAFFILSSLLAGCTRPPVARVHEFDPDSIPEAYARSTAALMAPGSTRAFQITPEGDLANGAWRVHIRPAAGDSVAGSPRSVAADERCWPVFRWNRRAGAVRFEFEAAALPNRAPDDSALLVSVRVRARNDGSAPAAARVSWTLEGRGEDPLFRAWDFDPDREGEAALRWATAHDRGEAHALGKGRVTDRTLETSWTLAPGMTSESRIVCTTYPRPARSLRAFAARPHGTIAAEVRSNWESALSKGAHLEVGDPIVEHAWDAARIVLLSLRERRGTRWVPIGGPYHYRDVWLRDGSRAVHALTVSGHVAEARAVADGLTLFQWPNDAFLSQRGQLDGTGQALWAFEQSHLRPAADTSVRGLADASWRAVGWAERQRNFGKVAGWPFARMLPFGDPRDAELVRAQLTGNDAWMLAGYRAAERLLRAAGRTADADSVARAATAYARDFREALARTGSPDIPPSYQRVGRDWGNLSVGYPCRALSWSDPRLAALAARAWREAGGPGLGFYGQRDSLHSYDFADLASWALRTGRRAEADRMLDAMLAWRTASGGAAEMFSGSHRDWGRNPPPHATSAAVLVDLLRNALVFDEDDTLHLTLGARDAWWRHGARLQGAPTWWGTLDLEFETNGREARWKWSPVPVWTSLTLPPGTTLEGDPTSPLVRGGNGSIVLAPPGTQGAHVRLRPQNGAS